MKPLVCKASSGYVLYLVVVALSILGVLSSIVLLSLRSTTQATIIDQKKFQAGLLAESGIARVEYFLNGGDNHNLQWETDSLSEHIENVGDIFITCRHFGGYARLTCMGVTGKASSTCVGLMGRNVPDSLKPVITLTEDINGLVFDSLTQVQGTIILDYDYVYRRIGGGLKRLKDMTVVSPRPSNPLPFFTGPPDSVFERMSVIAQQSKQSSTAHVTGTAFARESDSLLRAQVVSVSGDCELRNIRLENKTIIASGALIIADNAEFVFCTFVSKKVALLGGKTRKCLFYSPEKQELIGGNHDSQFFCKDTIHVSNSAKFSGTTLWVSRKSVGRNKDQHGCIQFDEAGSYTGCALCYNDSMERTNHKYRGNSISLGKKASFKGFLVTDGDLEIGNNTIEGNIWAKKIIGKANDQVKINEIYACSIKPLLLEMPFPLVGGNPVEVRNYYLSKESRIKN